MFKRAITSALHVMAKRREKAGPRKKVMIVVLSFRPSKLGKLLS